MRRRALIASLVLAVAASAVAQQGEQPRGAQIERPIVTTGRGPHKLQVDVPLLAGAQRFSTVIADAVSANVRDGLGDLRLFDRDGREVPYLLIDPAARRVHWIHGSVLSIAETTKTSGFEADFGHAHLIDAITVDGLQAPFLKRMMLEGSGDRSRWTVLIREGTLFDLPQERVRQTTLTFASGSYRYVRVTWDDTNSARVPLPRQVLARAVNALPSGRRPLRENIPFERQASEPGRSRYRLHLPAAGLPIVAVVLAAGSGDVFRTVTALESRFNGVRADPAEIGRARLMQTEQPGEAVPMLRLPIERPQSAELQLVVEDGNNAPLSLEAVSVEFANLPWIYFEAPEGSVTARYGSRTGAVPQYDLEARRQSINLDKLPEALWGDPHAIAGTLPPRATAQRMPDRGAKIDAAGFRYRRSVPISAEGLIALQLDAAVLSHSRGPSNAFADVRLVDDEGYQIPYLIERRDEPLAIDLTLQHGPADVRGLPESNRDNQSIYALILPYDNLPNPRIVLETSERIFRRSIRLGVERPADRRHRDAWFEDLAHAEWQHGDQGTSAPPTELVIPRGDVTRLLLVVNEGDNRPLPITSARLLLPSWRLRFFRSAGHLQLIYGRDDAGPPQYDLALLAPAVMGAAAHDVVPAGEVGSARSSSTILSPRLFWIGLGLAVLILLALIVRLISSGTPPPPSPSGP
jgi:hypothetical protein